MTHLEQIIELENRLTALLQKIPMAARIAMPNVAHEAETILYDLSVLRADMQANEGVDHGR